MSNDQRTPRGKRSSTQPGSSIEDAKAVGGKGDFGAPERDVTERTYVSENTKRADPGAAQKRAGVDSRTAGAGGNDSGVGSSSGGDLDTDIIGVGTGSGIAASGKIHEPAGPDDATSPAEQSISGPSRKRVKKSRATCEVHGTTVQPADDRTTAPEGADAASRPEPGDDAFAGEVSSDEATGRNDAGD